MDPDIDDEELDEEFDNVPEEDHQDEDVNDTGIQVHSCNPFKELLNGYVAKTKSTKDVRHIDVLYMSHHFTKLVEGVEDKTKNHLRGHEFDMLDFNILKEMVEKAEKIKQKMRDCLHLQLENVLRLPDIAVSQVLDLLLDQSKSDNNWEAVNFEENFDHDYRKILSDVHDYFARTVQIIIDELSDPCCVFCIADHISEIVYVVECMEEDPKDDRWQTYFGIKAVEDFDFWEDISEMEDAFGGLFVEEE